MVLVLTRLTASCVLLLAAFCWGAGNVANKTVLEHLAPLTVVGLRCLVGALVIAPFAWPDLRRMLAKGAGQAGQGWVKSALTLSVLFATALVLQQLAYRFTSVTNASFLVNTATVLTPILAWLLLGHRVGLAVVCAAPMTLIGAMFMSGFKSGGRFSLATMNAGDVLCLASAVAYAGWMVALGQHARSHGRPLGTAFMQFATSAVLVLPVAFWTGAPRFAAIAQAAPELFVLGVVSTALAFGLQTWAQQYVAASTAAVLVSAESLFGAVGAHALLGEQTPVLGLTGAALVLTAITCVALGDRMIPPTGAKAADPSGRPQPEPALPINGRLSPGPGRSAALSPLAPVPDTTISKSVWR